MSSSKTSITVAAITGEKLLQECASWGKRLRFLDSFSLPFQGVLTRRFLGFIFIRNAAFPHISASQVLRLLRNAGNVLALSLSWATLICRTIMACGRAEPREEVEIQCLQHNVDKPSITHTDL